VHYARVPRLFADIELAHGDGSFARLFRTLTKADLLILDDRLVHNAYRLVLDGPSLRKPSGNGLEDKPEALETNEEGKGRRHRRARGQGGKGRSRKGPAPCLTKTANTEIN
jgi:hypothetical protein